MGTEITRYGGDGSGRRSCGFEAASGLRVLVTPGDIEKNEAAWALATSLATAESRLAAAQEEMGALRCRFSELQAKLPPARGAQVIGRGYVRFTDRGELWILSGREKGWGHFGYRCADWDDLFRRWNVRVVDHGTDTCGAWWAVENLDPEGR